MRLNVTTDIREVKQVILLTLFVKICIFSIILIGFHTLPFNKDSYLINFHYPVQRPISIENAFTTWDAQGYLYLSEFGYKPNDNLNRFYPLFPLLIKLFTPIFRNPLFAGLFLSNIFSLIGIVYFYLFVKDYFKNNKRLAYKSVLVLLVFPTSFYFTLVYSESLCFFLTILFFYYLYKKQFVYASIFALLLPLSRPVGVFIIFPFAIYLAQYILSISPKQSFVRHVNQGGRDKRTYFLLSPIVGLLLYFVFMQITTENFTSGFTAAGHVVAGWNVTNIFHPDLFIRNIFSPVVYGHVYSNSLIDRAFFIVFVGALYFIYKKLDNPLFVYSLLFGSVPLFGSFMSYTRYLLLIFPLFMVLAIFFSSKQPRIYLILIIGSLVLLQVAFLLSHTLHYWVS